MYSTSGTQERPFIKSVQKRIHEWFWWTKSLLKWQRATQACKEFELQYAHIQAHAGEGGRETCYSVEIRPPNPSSGPATRIYSKDILSASHVWPVAGCAKPGHTEDPDMIMSGGNLPFQVGKLTAHFVPSAVLDGASVLFINYKSVEDHWKWLPKCLRQNALQDPPGKGALCVTSRSTHALTYQREGKSHIMFPRPLWISSAQPPVSLPPHRPLPRLLKAPEIQFK